MSYSSEDVTKTLQNGMYRVIQFHIFPRIILLSLKFFCLNQVNRGSMKQLKRYGLHE